MSLNNSEDPLEGQKDAFTNMPPKINSAVSHNVYPTLGLCMKAGKLAAGEAMVEKAIKNGTAKLVIIASDASDNTKKKFGDMCSYRSVEMMVFSDKQTLGKTLGKEVRASLCILDEHFAKNIKLKISDNKI